MLELNYQQRKEFIAAYDMLVGEIMEHDDAELYYVSFMFHQLRGSRSSQIIQMIVDVTRFHDILKKHVVRKPDAPNWSELVPVLIGVPDLPVWKHKKVPVRNLQVNDGLHYNAIVLMPPRLEGSRVTGIRESRLRLPLDIHVQQKQHLYTTEKMYRIHVTMMSRDTVVNYMFKNILNGRISLDDILILK
jgi:hypothetical protein